MLMVQKISVGDHVEVLSDVALTQVIINLDKFVAFRFICCRAATVVLIDGCQCSADSTQTALCKRVVVCQ